MKTTYDFARQLAIGEAHERRIDEHFARWFAITPATRDEQRAAYGTLHDIGARAREMGFEAPVLFLVGEAVDAAPSRRAPSVARMEFFDAALL